MVNAGHIRFGSTYINRRFYKIYNLTEKGFKVLKSIRPMEVSKLQLKSNSLVHDLHLINIFESIKDSRKVDHFVTENELQCLTRWQEEDFIKDFVELNSDGYLCLKINNENYHTSVEYEHSENSKKKYENLVIDYYLNSSVDVVLFFTNKDWIRNHMIQVEKEQYQNQDPKFYFLKTKYELRAIDDFTFMNRKGQKLKL